MVNNGIYSTLHFIAFANLSSWDVKSFNINSQKFNFKTIELKEVLSKTEIQWVEISDSMEYPILGVRAHGQGVYINRVAKGHELTMKRYQRSKINTLFFCKVRTVGGQWGIVYPIFADSYASSNMTYLDINFTKIMPEYLEMLLKIQRLTHEWDKNAIGADGRHFTLNTMLNLQIPLPTLEEQSQLVVEYQAKIDFANDCEKQAQKLEQSIETYLYNELGLETSLLTKHKSSTFLKFINCSEITQWDYKSIFVSSIFNAKYYIGKLGDLIIEKPKYGSNSKTLNEITEIRYIRITDINEDGTLNENIVSSENPDDAYLLRDGDFLIARSGNTVGKTFVYKSEYGKCIYAGYLIKFVFDTSKVNLTYLLFYTKSHLYKLWIKNTMRCVGQPNINSQEYLSSPIILPRLDIQNKIAEYITSIKNQIKELKLLAKQNRSNAILDFEKAVFHHENH
jgi:restriction endonuclease S subunit